MAGVVEYQTESPFVKNFTLINLEGYIKIINSNDAQQLDIIIFPESSLSNAGSYIPEPKDKITPCNSYSIEYDEVIRRISCVAKTAEKYILVNLIEISKCTSLSQQLLNDTRPCAPNGLNRYNSNVVFDRKGMVISKYRKFNLFGEAGINTTVTADVSTFKTDFGVTFGHFICFDLMFQKPAMDLLSLGVTDILFPAMWFSEIPFLTAAQVQENWAYAKNVNLLAAGANNAGIGSTGTGIYGGRLGALVSVMNYKFERKLYTAKVPKINFPSSEIESYVPKRIEFCSDSMLDLKLLRDHLDVYQSIKINETHDPINISLCHEKLCCKFYIKLSLKGKATLSQRTYKYRAMVFDGVRTFSGVATGGVSACAIVACTNDLLSSCGLRFDKYAPVYEKFVFDNILVEGTFEGGNSMLTMPNSLKTNIMPLDVNDYTYVENLEYTKDGKQWRYIASHLFTSTSDLLTFGIYGRNFKKDG